MDKTEFAQRRQLLMEMMGPSSMAILSTGPLRTRNGNTDYRYRPDSYFYYLTGFPEPEAIAVLIPEREQGRYILFCRERDPGKELWHGRRAGLEGACDYYGADDAFPITDIDDIIPGLMESCRRLYYPMGHYATFDQQIMDWLNQLRGRIRTGVVPPREMVALDHLLQEMRLYKSPAEIAVMRTAADLTVRAHKRAMQCCRPGMYEYQLAAEIEYEFAKAGCQAPAYPTIVGGGANGCILHYIENSEPLQEGDLVLIDAGAEFDYYAADITRTFPINGRFSPSQKIIYELVLKAQKAALDTLYPGHHWDEPYQAAVQVITEGLRDLGLLVGKLEVLLEEEAYKRFYMHRIGHWLGMDVHDPGEYKVDNEWRLLEAGMVMTVEPGIYIPAADDIPQEWWNIGVRIEDDVLITEEGHEVLTAELPKSVWEIEELMNN